MQIGKRRHRIRIEKPFKSDDPFASADGWLPIITMWANIKPLTGKEVFQVSELAMKVSHLITIRHPGPSYPIHAGYRIVYGNRIFKLETGILNPEERNIDLELMAFEIDP